MVTYTFTNGTIADADEVNQNFLDAEKAGAIAGAQNAYQTLKQSGSFDNEDFIIADRFTDSSGANDTVNTGSSTAGFGTDSYSLSSVDGTEESATATNENSILEITNYSVSIINGGYFSEFNIDSSDGSVLGTIVIRAGTDIILNKSYTTSTSGVNVSISSSEYSRLLEDGETATVQISASSGNIRTKTGYSYSGTNFSISSQEINSNNTSAIPMKYTPATRNTDSTVVADSNTLLLDGTETGLGVYAKVDDFIYTGTGDGTDDTDAHSVTLNNTGSITSTRGIKFKCKNETVFKSVNKSSTCTATTAYLQELDGTILETASFSTDTATFSKDLVLKVGKEYLLLVDAGGSSYTYTNNNPGTSLPITTGTNIDFISGWTTVANTTTLYNIESITTQDLSGSATKATDVTVDIMTTDKTTVTGTPDGTDDTNDLGFIQDSTTTSPLEAGIRLYFDGAKTIENVTKNSNCTATKCKLIDEQGNIIEDVSFSGDVATFSGNTNFYGFVKVIAHSDGGSFTTSEDFYTTGSHTWSSSGFIVNDLKVLGITGSTNSASIFNITEVVTQDVAITESTFGIPINQITNISSLNAGDLKLTFNLTTTDTSFTPKIYGYAGVLVK